MDKYYSVKADLDVYTLRKFFDSAHHIEVILHKQYYILHIVNVDKITLQNEPSSFPRNRCTVLYNTQHVKCFDLATK